MTRQSMQRPAGKTGIRDRLVSAFPFLSPQQLFLGAIILIALLASWPLLREPGLLNTRGGGDSPFLLQRLHQLETAVFAGHFPVRWMPDANYGYGYPFYNYYAPLSIYITFLFRLLGFSYVGAIKLSQLAGFVVAAWGMFRLGQLWFKQAWAGWLTALAYTVAPFHMVNVYVRGDSLAEFWAMAFYPWVILAAETVWSRFSEENGNRKTAVAGFALAYAALILSHNISAMIFSPFLLLFIGLKAQFKQPPMTKDTGRQRVHLLLGIGGALLLALGLAAWFFLPALAEQNLAQLGPVTEGYFHFSNHFRGTDLIQRTVAFDYNPDAGVAFRMGLVQAVTAVLGLVVLLGYGNRRRGGALPLVFIVAGLIVATFMITPLSRYLWDYLPLLAFTQFPWRFLSVQAFMAALATGGLALLPWRRLLLPVVAVALLAAGLSGLAVDHLTLADADITAEKLAQYEWFTGNIGSTVSAEYLPQTVQPRPYTSAWLQSGDRWDVTAITGELRAATLLQARAIAQEWQITAVSAATLRFPTLYWPGWQATLDGESLALQAAPGTGLIQLDVPAGEHTVALQLGRTRIRLLAELISLAAVVVLLWLAATWRFRINRRLLVVVLMSLALIIVGNHFWPEPAFSPDDLTWDFAQMGYLHHDVAGIAFDDGPVLRSYAYRQDSAVPGNSMTITLDWQGGSENREATLMLTTPARAWPAFEPSAPYFVQQTHPVTPGQTDYTFQLPATMASGLILPRLSVAGTQPVMDSGKTRGTVYLRPFFVVKQPVTSVNPHPLDVQAVAVSLRDPVTIDVQLAWFTQRPLSHNDNVSLRLLNQAGEVVSQWDGQPGYGFNPASQWPLGQWQSDWLALSLPASGLVEPLALVAYLYDVNTLAIRLQRGLGQVQSNGGGLSWQGYEPLAALPDLIMGETALFSQNDQPIITLRGYQRQQSAQQLTLTFYWESTRAVPTNYTRFVHLLPANQSAPPLAQADSMPRGNSYPTSQWLPGQIIEDQVMIDTSQLPPGNYQIVVGLYENLGDHFPRLTAVSVAGDPWENNGVVLEEMVIE